MAELADVLDLGSSAPGVQVRPLLSAPEKADLMVCLFFFIIYINQFGNSTHIAGLTPYKNPGE